MGMSTSMKKINYTIELKSVCPNKAITEMLILYDGVDIIGFGGSDLGNLGTRSYNMPLTIPKIANVSWKNTSNKYEYNVPLRSLITPHDILGSKFKVIFSVCDSQLSVVLGKKVGRFEYDKKEIWSSEDIKNYQNRS